MGSNVIASSSEKSRIKGTPCKQDKPEDLTGIQESKMELGSDSESESVEDTNAAEDYTDSNKEDVDEDDASVVSEGESEDDASTMDDNEQNDDISTMDDNEQNDDISVSSDSDENEDKSRTMAGGDGVEFSDCDDEFEKDEENMDVEGGESSDIRVAANPAWAQAMAKILRTKKPLGKKAVVLSKAKTIQAAESSAAKKQDDQSDFEIVGEKEGKPGIKTEDAKPTAEELLQAKRERLAQCRVKQDEFDYNRERALTKIATKGVVQLFNAVRAQQKNLGSKLAEAHSTRMEEKLLKSIDKNSFLEHLTGKIRSRPVEEIASPAKKEEVEIVLPKSWNELSKKVESSSWDKEIEIKEEPED